MNGQTGVYPKGSEESVKRASNKDHEEPLRELNLFSLENSLGTHFLCL